jgi:adiponectin receptor
MPWIFGGLFYIGGALLYVFRFPEKYFPKMFDKLGSSHQIFHICCVIGCTIHFNESMGLFMKRKEHLCPITLPQ